MQWSKEPENDHNNQFSDEDQQEDNYNDIEMECANNEDINEGYIQQVPKEIQQPA